MMVLAAGACLIAAMETPLPIDYFSILATE
jgi:hypothetical protein